MHRVERLEPSSRKKGRVLVWFAGVQEPLRVTEREVLSFSLWAGRELGEEDYDALCREAMGSFAKSEAARLLAHRPLSRRELELRLREKGVPEEQTAQALQAMEDLGALDDLEYAKTVVRHYSAQGWGEQKLKSELSRRGVPQDLWEEALNLRPDPVDLVERALRQRRGDLQDPRERRRATDALLRRGFTWEEIREGLNRLGGNLEEESI